jgi:hypothetical protein
MGPAFGGLNHCGTLRNGMRHGIKWKLNIFLTI